jgi:hypothetical protein
LLVEFLVIISMTSKVVVVLILGLLGRGVLLIYWVLITFSGIYPREVVFVQSL